MVATYGTLTHVTDAAKYGPRKTSFGESDVIWHPAFSCYCKRFKIFYLLNSIQFGRKKEKTPASDFLPRNFQNSHPIYLAKVKIFEYSNVYIC
jgi:hypothetical protein